VKDFLRISSRAVSLPSTQHPKRPVTGFDCARREVSGDRFWGFFKEACGGNAHR
jgi:single-strand selective monofunctional uracil DNA glycosylase